MTPTHARLHTPRLLLHLLLIQGVTWAIKITNLDVPVALAVGDDGWLACEWDDEGDHVYALKWYVSGEEFYRWTPLESPAIKTFPSVHFKVDGRESHRGRVKIRNVTVSAGGKYRCEISGEAPKFKTSFATADMIVVDLPDSRPRIEGDNEAEPFQLHQTVTLNCFSVDALPAPSLTFYINNEPVNPEWEQVYQILRNETTGLETSHKSVQLKLAPSMVPLGLLQVKCSASYPDLQLYWESSEKTFSVATRRGSGLPFGSREFSVNDDGRRLEAANTFTVLLLFTSLIMR